jgi:hypothetical protein
MLNEQGIKALLPKPKTQTTVSTAPAILETPPSTTLPPGIVKSTNSPIQTPGDRLIFDPADFTNFNTVTLPAQKQVDMSTDIGSEEEQSQPLMDQLPQEIEIPEENVPNKGRNYLIIILIAVAIAVIALIAFFTMRRKASGNSISNTGVNNSFSSPRNMNITPQ